MITPHNEAPSSFPSSMSPIVVEGWLRKRSSKAKGSKFWSTRYFVLRQSGMLSYYTRKSDVEHRGQMQLVRGCSVSLAYSDGNNNNQQPILMNHVTSTSNSVETEGFDVTASTGIGQLSLTSPGNTSIDHSQRNNNNNNRLYVLRITWPAISSTINNNSNNATIEVSPNPETEGFSTDTAPSISLNYESGAEDMMKDGAVTKRGRTKKRLIQGSKYAAATGAAVTIGVLTAGIGLAAGLTFVAVSAAAGGGGVVASKTLSRSRKISGARDLPERTLMLATTEFETVQQWKKGIDSLLEKLNAGSLQSDHTSMTSEAATFSTVYDTIISTLNGRYDSDAVLFSASQQQQTPLTQKSQWKPITGGWGAILGFTGHGLRIYSEDVMSDSERRARRRVPILTFGRRELSVKDRPCPAFKSQVILNAKPMDAFCHLMTHGYVSNINESVSGFVPDHTSSSFRIIESMDQHMDIIHVAFRPLYLFPTWTAPRDFCLSRYWKYEDDGTYVICFDSTVHRECPPLPGYVRGDLHGVYMISPRKCKADGISSTEECLMTQIIQIDPKGWVPTTKVSILGGQGYADAFSITALLQMLDIRDTLNYNRFIATDKGSMYRQTQLKTLIATTLNTGENPDYKVDSNEVDEDDDYDESNDLIYERKPLPTITKDTNASPSTKKSITSIRSTPSPFRLNMWAEPDSKSFRVRGKNYLNDKKKISPGESMFRLIAVDLVETPQNIMSGMCTHPRERVVCAMKREAEAAGSGDMPPFVFVLNIAIPGPPFLHLVIYFAVDNIDSINGKDGTPFSKLSNKFFFGDNDVFRDNTFKLIPRIVEGNFIVRKAVGSTPAIMGTKLKQYYVRSDRYFEIILDIGSSSVAAGVIRLASGYAKTLIVDMGFVLEGNDESVLPEKIMGCCRLKNVSFKNLRKVALPDDD